MTDVRWPPAAIDGRTGVLGHVGDHLLGTVDLDTAQRRVATVRVRLDAAELTAVRGSDLRPAGDGAAAHGRR